MVSSGSLRITAFAWTVTALAVAGVVGALCLARINLDLAAAVVLGSTAFLTVAISLVSPYFRFIAFIGAALLIMQSDSGALASAKPAYLAFVGFVGVMGAVNAARLTPEVRRAFRPIFAASILVLCVVVLESIASIVNGMDPSRVIRDATTYLMIVAAPFAAADASRTGTPERARRTLATFALLSALTFAIYWLSARGVGTLSVTKLGMNSFFLPACGFVVGLAYGLVRRKLSWTALGAACLLAVLVTGSRSGLVMLVGLFALLGSKSSRRVPPARMVLGLSALGLALAFVLPAVINAVATQGFFAQRAAALSTVFSQGISADQSGVIRLRALAITLQVWQQNPLLGVGFGYKFPSPSPDLPPVDFQLDSPGLVLAKFGIVGTVALLTALLMFARGIHRFHLSTAVRSEAQPSGIGFILIVLAFSILGMPMEDKGFSLAFALIFALLASEARTATDSRQGNGAGLSGSYFGGPSRFVGTAGR